MKWVWRILGGIVALLVLCVAGLYLYGLRRGHGFNSAEVVIDRPIQQVWRYITDDDLIKKWIVGLDEIKLLSGETNQVGARLRLVETYQGERVQMEMLVTAFEAPKHIAFKLDSLGDPNSGFHELAECQLEETNGRTRLRLSGSTEYYGFIFKLLEPLITPAAQKKLQEDLERLKKVVEAEPVMTAAPEKQ